MPPSDRCYSGTEQPLAATSSSIRRSTKDSAKPFFTDPQTSEASVRAVICTGFRHIVEGRTFPLAVQSKLGLSNPRGATSKMPLPRRGLMQPSTDAEIRGALHRKALRAFHGRADTLVIDELGLAHAKARIDVAVINGCAHGFEIKSAADNLARLPRQLGLYEECLEKLTIVCAEKHVPGVRKLAPRWCGILQVAKGSRGGIEFLTLCEPKRNPRVQAHRLAHLLWRPEAEALLSRLNAPPEVLRAPRKALYESLAAVLSVEEITAFIKESMVARQDWRSHQAHA